MTRIKSYTILLLAIIYSIIWFWAAYAPVNRFIWFLENILIFLFLAVFISMHRFYIFSIPSYLTITIFFTLHTIGAHYSYQTPIDPWLQQWFTLDRAYYDRVVHFCFGLFMVIPVKDWLTQLLSQSSKRVVFFFSMMTIFATGAFYELIEMWVAHIVAPGQATVFLGLQGDPWDAHHDMELALYGSIFTLSIYAFINWYKKKPFQSKS